MGHFARVCRSNTENARKRINHIEETYNDEEQSEPEKIQQITRINRILPDKNDHYEIKMEINGKYQILTSDTGSPVTIMPNNPELFNQKDIQPLKERYQDVSKNEIKVLGKLWADIEYNGEKKNKNTIAYHTKKRHPTTTRCKLAKRTANHHQQSPIG